MISGLALCLAGCIPCQAAILNAQDWQFTTGANPAAPTVSINACGTATATLAVGFAGVGWQASLGGFGTRTGLWDLGGQNPAEPAQDTRGRVSLNIPNPASSNASTYTDVALRVVQFVDGFLYTGDLTFSLPGAIAEGRSVIEAIPPEQGGGNWVEDSFNWRLTPSPGPISLVMTGATNGTLLDRIRVEDTSSVPEPSSLLITSVTKSNNFLVVTWSGGQPPYQVFLASSLGSNMTWQPVGSPSAGTNAAVSIEAPAGFIRVREGN